MFGPLPAPCDSMYFGVDANSDWSGTKLTPVACIACCEEEKRRKEKDLEGRSWAIWTFKATSTHVGRVGVKGSCVFGNFRPFTCTVQQYLYWRGCQPRLQWELQWSWHPLPVWVVCEEERRKKEKSSEGGVGGYLYFWVCDSRSLKRANHQISATLTRQRHWLDQREANQTERL